MTFAELLETQGVETGIMIAQHIRELRRKVDLSFDPKDTIFEDATWLIDWSQEWGDILEQTIEFKEA